MHSIFIERHRSRSECYLQVESLDLGFWYWKLLCIMTTRREDTSTIFYYENEIALRNAWKKYEAVFLERDREWRRRQVQHRARISTSYVWSKGIFSRLLTACGVTVLATLRAIHKNASHIFFSTLIVESSHAVRKTTLNLDDELALHRFSLRLFDFFSGI